MTRDPYALSDTEEEAKGVGRVGLTVATLISLYAVGVIIGLVILFVFVL